MSTIEINSTKVFTQSFDGGGVTYRRGASLGDVPLAVVQNGAVISNIIFDDLNFRGTNGVARVSGEGSAIDHCTLNNCQRYGFITGSGNNLRITNNVINKGQHCISGSSGSDGEWNPNYDTLIEGNTIRGMILHGIKLKNMQRAIVRNNIIDCAPLQPGYDGETAQRAKVGIVFANGDATTKDCVVENNTIFRSFTIEYPSYGVEVTNLNTASVEVPSGNKIRGNRLSDLYYGVYLMERTQNYLVSSNSVVNVKYPYVDKGVNNIIVEGENMVETQSLKGEVSAQVAVGEVVSIVITKPDLTKETVTAPTDAVKGYTASYTGAPGNYSAAASIGEDAEYLGATSSVFSFTLSKRARTITLHG